MTIEQTSKKLRLIFVICITSGFVGFIADVLYTSKHVVITEHVAWERWGIIITLAGIFAALKILHPKLNNTDRLDETSALKKYVSKYLIRIALLVGICIFNLTSLYITGIKNFTYMAFITIFAMLLCAPSRKHIENEIKELEEEVVVEDEKEV